MGSRWSSDLDDTSTTPLERAWMHRTRNQGQTNPGEQRGLEWVPLKDVSEVLERNRHGNSGRGFGVLLAHTNAGR